MLWTLPIGAQPTPEGTRFRVWAADAQRAAVVRYEGDQHIATYELAPEEHGYFAGIFADISAGTKYMYQLDGKNTFPDPAARFQPVSVHKPSQVIDPSSFDWTDQGWNGVALEDLIIYELHIGTATPAGTFDSLIERLDDIRGLGVTAIELMPVADFPGNRNWGYDGVCLFAPARAYGGPHGMCRLIDAAHARGLAVILDVVYNHLGPDGNYLRQFSGAYFTKRHQTPWGDALNVDGPDSRPVRDFFIANACYWAHEYHIDGLRFDATHAICDDSPTHILAEITARVRETLPAGRKFVFIAEDERNDSRLVRTQRSGGLGLDAVWADDFHHQVRVALAGDCEGYYMDFSGSAADLATTMQRRWFYIGQHSKYLNRARGTPADDLEPTHFVYCIQNHDQVGNRALGDRLHHTIAPEAYRAASMLLLLSPYTPLLWMGQEWAASTPFLYFTDHTAELGRLVTEGRQAEFAAFTAFSNTTVPDPQAPETFLKSKLRWEEREEPQHAGMLLLYRDLLALRCQLSALRESACESFNVTTLGVHSLLLRRTGPQPHDTLLLIVNLSGTAQFSLDDQDETAPRDRHHWELLLDSEAARYGGAAANHLEECNGRQCIHFLGAGALLLGQRAV